MNPDEKQSMYIANCKACSLSEAMKDCPFCQFNTGLLIKALSSIGKLPVNSEGQIVMNPLTQD